MEDWSRNGHWRTGGVGKVGLVVAARAQGGLGRSAPPPADASQSASSRPSPKTKMREIVHLQVGFSPFTYIFTYFYLLYLHCFITSKTWNHLMFSAVRPKLSTPLNAANPSSQLSFEPQAGQCGNQIGAKFWEIISDEHVRIHKYV